MRDVAAIKCIQKRSLSKSATENLLTEIELLKKLDHEHIVKLKDFEVSKAAAVPTTVHVNVVCFFKKKTLFFPINSEAIIIPGLTVFKERFIHCI